MPITFLAQATSDNAPGGAVLTFAFPVILFAVIAAILYFLLFRRHSRVPAQRVAHASAASGPPDPGAAHASAVAAGMPTASGGGAAESGTEPAGAKRDTLPGSQVPGAGNGAGRVPGEAEGPEQGTTEGTEASE